MNSFLDRREAGRMLADRLGEYANRSDVTVFAMPRGGIPVAFEVARALAVPLDVFLVRKVYEPGHDDIRVGTITSGGYEILDTATIAARGVDRRIADREMARARMDLAYQERVYRGTRAFPDVQGRTAILVYDGIVTGDSMVAAVAALRARGAAGVVVAAPSRFARGQRIAGEGGRRVRVRHDRRAVLSHRDLVRRVRARKRRERTGPTRQCRKRTQRSGRLTMVEVP